MSGKCYDNTSLTFVILSLVAWQKQSGESKIRLSSFILPPPSLPSLPSPSLPPPPSFPFFPFSPLPPPPSLPLLSLLPPPSSSLTFTSHSSSKVLAHPCELYLTFNLYHMTVGIAFWLVTFSLQSCGKLLHSDWSPLSISPQILSLSHKELSCEIKSGNLQCGGSLEWVNPELQLFWWSHDHSVTVQLDNLYLAFVL